MGCSWAALRAGQKPKKIPIPAETVTAITTLATLGATGQPESLPATREIAPPSSTPTIPPTSELVATPVALPSSAPPGAPAAAQPVERDRVEERPERPDYIVTEPGIGYRFRDAE